MMLTVHLKSHEQRIVELEQQVVELRRIVGVPPSLGEQFKGFQSSDAQKQMIAQSQSNQDQINQLQAAIKYPTT